jgi:hypothetical protein
MIYEVWKHWGIKRKVKEVWDWIKIKQHFLLNIKTP